MVLKYESAWVVLDKDQSSVMWVQERPLGRWKYWRCLWGRHRSGSCCCCCSDCWSRLRMLISSSCGDDGDGGGDGGAVSSCGGADSCCDASPSSRVSLVCPCSCACADGARRCRGATHHPPTHTPPPSKRETMRLEVCVFSFFRARACTKVSIYLSSGTQPKVEKVGTFFFSVQ